MELFSVYIGSMIRLSIPLLFAALGGLISERAGLANVALEGKLLLSAFFAAAIAALTGSPWLGLIAGIVGGGFGGYVFSALSIFTRADHIVMGVAFNMLVAGLIPTICKAFFGMTGGTPQLTLGQRLQAPWAGDFAFFGAAIALAIILYWALKETKWGLRIKAAGDEPSALRIQGVSPAWVRVWAGTLAGAVTGIGGIDLSLVQGSGYIRDMASGRGFIALAALILGGWRPLPTFFACLVFALADTAQMMFQGNALMGIHVPNSLVQIVPYLATVLVLVARFSGSRMLAPRASNQPISP